MAWHQTLENYKAWWRHQMETFSALLAICAGNSPLPGEFPAQRPVTRSFDVFFDLRLNKRLNKQSWGWWFETLSRPFWRHRNGFMYSPLLKTVDGMIYTYMYVCQIVMSIHLISFDLSNALYWGWKYYSTHKIHFQDKSAKIDIFKCTFCNIPSKCKHWYHTKRYEITSWNLWLWVYTRML